MILVDANVLMYAVGRDHPNKQASLTLLTKIANAEIEATIDAEILQEILHRYRSINRWEDGQRVYELAYRLFPNVLPITVEVMDQALRLMNENDSIQCRDAVHAGVVAAYKLEAILTFDSDFDRIPGLQRITPSTDGQ